MYILVFALAEVRSQLYRSSFEKPLLYFDLSFCGRGENTAIKLTRLGSLREGGGY